MLQASYALHLFSSNSRSVLEGGNRLASTFPPKPHKTRLFFGFSTPETNGTNGRRSSSKWQKCSIFAKLLLLLGGSRQSPSSVSYAALRARRSSGAIHTRLTFLETRAALGIY